LLCGVFSYLPRLLSFKRQDGVVPIPLTKPAIEFPTLQG